MKLNIKVVANSSKNSIEKTGDGFKVHLKEKALKGKANRALIDFLAECFKIKKSQVAIVAGLTSNQKIVEIF